MTAGSRTVTAELCFLGYQWWTTALWPQGVTADSTIIAKTHINESFKTKTKSCLHEAILSHLSSWLLSVSLSVYHILRLASRSMREHCIGASQENHPIFLNACQRKPESVHFEAKRIVSAVLDLPREHFQLCSISPGRCLPYHWQSCNI